MLRFTNLSDAMKMTTNHSTFSYLSMLKDVCFDMPTVALVDLDLNDVKFYLQGQLVDSSVTVAHWYNLHCLHWTSQLLINWLIKWCCKREINEHAQTNMTREKDVSGTIVCICVCVSFLFLRLLQHLVSITNSITKMQLGVSRHSAWDKCAATPERRLLRVSQLSGGTIARRQ